MRLTIDMRANNIADFRRALKLNIDRRLEQGRLLRIAIRKQPTTAQLRKKLYDALDNTIT